MYPLDVLSENLQRDSTYLSVNLRMSDYCIADNYTVLVGFGTRVGNETACMVSINSTTVILTPGRNANFRVKSSFLPSLARNEEYCYTLYSFISSATGDPGGAVVTLPSTLLIMVMILLVTATLR